MKNQLSPAGAANLTLHQTNAAHVQEVSSHLNIALAQMIPAVTKRHRRKRSTEDSCLKSLAFTAEIQHSLKQRRVGHVGVASGVLTVLGTFGQHEMIRTADAMGGVPQANRDARTHDGADGERLRGGEDLTGDQIVPRVLIVESAQNSRQVFNG